MQWVVLSQVLKLRWIVATNLAVDNSLIDDGKQLGHHKTKREAVIVALETYVRRLRQQAALEAFGTIDYAAGHDYKTHRSL